VANREIRHYLPVILLFAAVALKFPLAAWYCFAPLAYHSRLEIMPDGAIAALALFLVLIRGEAGFRPIRGVLIAGAVMEAAVVLQSYTLSFFRVDYALGALLPPVLVVFAWRYGREVRDCLFPVLAVCWFLNLALTCRTGLAGISCYGLTGNWNWSAVLLMASSAATVFLVLRHVKKEGLKYGGAAVVLLLSIWQYAMLFSLSRGALTALAATLAALVLIRLYRPFPRLIRGVLVVTPIALAAVLVAARLNMDSPLFDWVREDARYYLMPGGLDVALGHYWFGVSPELYESFARETFSPGYFLSEFVAERNPHPHNELIFIAAAYGLAGFAAWLYLMFGAVAPFVRKLTGGGDARGALLFAVFCLLLVSGMVDVTLESWPCKYLFLLIAGVFWHEAKPFECGAAAPARIAAPLRIAAALMLCAALYLASLAAWSSWLYRRAEIGYDRGDKPDALRLLVRSAEIRPDPMVLYRAGLIALFDAKNPDLAMSALERIPALTGRKNFIGLHGLQGRIYALKEQPEKALECFAREAEISPYSITNWHLYAQVLEKAGRSAEAAAARHNYEESIRQKQVLPEHLPYLFRNQDYDLKTHNFIRNYDAGLIK